MQLPPWAQNRNGRFTGTIEKSSTGIPLCHADGGQSGRQTSAYEHDFWLSHLLGR